MNQSKKEQLLKLADRHPWLAMYIASLTPIKKTQGRPHSVFPRKQFSMQLTPGESKLIDEWQVIFSDLLGRKVNRGEVVGLVTRLAKEHYQELIAKGNEFNTFEDIIKAFKEGS
jgi:hypothetical protein